jgi:acyl-CoA reductase-like NAD-dependent aldehyde dehydrogenase
MVGKGAFEAEELITSLNPQQNPEDKTSFQTIDEDLAVLTARKEAWVATGTPERISILEEISRDTMQVAGYWINLCLEKKDTFANPIGEAEEWIFLATVVRALKVLRESLIDIQRYGRPRIPGKVTLRPNGQAVAEVFPRNRIEKLMYRGITGEVWMEPGVTVNETIRTQALPYRDKHYKGKVALVLGAGNTSLAAIIDSLHKLFIENQVVILKPNPVNAYLGPVIERVLQSLINRDFIRIVYGGKEAGSYLCYHPAIEEIHMTGSDKTFEAIIFGQGDEGAKRKRDKKPLIDKRFTSELGNISPVIIVPGPWSEEDIQHQSEHIATWVTANAGFGCLTPRVIIHYESWAHRKTFIEAIGHVLEHVETRKAYYPGAKERHAAFLAEHPRALLFGDTSGDRLPWTFITDVNPDNYNDICFRREAFCSLFAETALKATSVVDYIERAVEFANNTLWGTLNATIIVHPHSLGDTVMAAAIEHAIENLRYGTVTVNLLAYYSYHFMVAPWGAFPGSSIYDVQSGIGKTANSLMFERPQKSVIRAPFRKQLDPVIVKSKRVNEFARKMTYFEAAPALWKLPGLLWAAFRSRI